MVAPRTFGNTQKKIRTKISPSFMHASIESTTSVFIAWLLELQGLPILEILVFPPAKDTIQIPKNHVPTPLSFSVGIFTSLAIHVDTCLVRLLNWHEIHMNIGKDTRKRLMQKISFEPIVDDSPEFTCKMASRVYEYTEGHRIAVDYVAKEMQKLGLEPLGSGKL
jgi:hypothetical protein